LEEVKFELSKDLTIATPIFSDRSGPIVASNPIWKKTPQQMAKVATFLFCFALCYASSIALLQQPLLRSLNGARLFQTRTNRNNAHRWQSPVAKLGAILFDCDGVLADTERDGHRIALNIAMKEKGLKVGNQDMKCDEKV
jgi:hypothetical protein